MDVQERINRGATGAASVEAKPRRRAVAKPKAQAAAKRSLNLRIDADAYERLAVHAMKRNTTISGLVEQYAREHLREYYVARNGSGAGQGGRAGEGGEQS